MIRLFLLLLALPAVAWATSSRTIRLEDGDMAPIYLEPGFSTLLKFSSRPEPGLIGDQDGFKVEYMKNIVAIKPLLQRATTNLFVFTKEGQFNFQLVTGRGRHDNVVYIEPHVAKAEIVPAQKPRSVPIDNLNDRKIGKAVENKEFRLKLESLAQPPSRSSLIIKFSVTPKAAVTGLNPQWFSLIQGRQKIPIENLLLDHQDQKLSIGYILVRTATVNPKESMNLIFQPEHLSALSLSFIPAVHR